MALNRTLVGKTYPPVTIDVTLEALQKYAHACNDDSPYYFDSQAPDGIIAPPMFNAVATWLALITVISDPELRVDLLRLLHRAQEMEFHAPIRPEDRVSTTASISAIEYAPVGEIIQIGLVAANQHKRVVSKTRFTALIRGRRERDISQPAPPELAAEPDRPLVIASQAIDLDQTFRYAEASGDHNPIHLDNAVARMAGLPGIIVHGLCTMAFACKVIIDQVCDRNPARLRHLAASFSRPVFPGDMITTTIWPRNDPAERGCFRYETCNAAGATVLREGFAAIRD